MKFFLSHTWEDKKYWKEYLDYYRHWKFTSADTRVSFYEQSNWRIDLKYFLYLFTFLFYLFFVSILYFILFYSIRHAGLLSNTNWQISSENGRKKKEREIVREFSGYPRKSISGTARQQPANYAVEKQENQLKWKWEKKYKNIKE